MYYGNIKNLDIANGPGCRVSLFVSGCRNHCKGCFQPETWDFNYGKEFTGETLSELMRLLENPHIKGLSILGGDPFEPENRNVIWYSCKTIREFFGDQKSIWMWTGYYLEDLKDLPVFNYVDVLVDGPFIESQKNLCLPYSGSENQRVINVKKSLESGEVVLWTDGNMKKGCDIREGR